MNIRKGLLPFFFTMICAGTLSGCASNFTIDSDEIDVPRPGEDVRMPLALKYSNAMKEATVSHASTQFNIGQGMNGVLMAGATAATALLAFDGNQTAAAATGLGAGLIGLTDRFLLVDESLAIYKSTVDALNCAESLLVPLAVPSKNALSKSLVQMNEASANMNMLSLEAEPFVKLLGFDATASVETMAVASSLGPTMVEALSATNELAIAVNSASDEGTTNDRAASRLVLLVDQVRQSLNAVLLQKRATTEEITAAFQKSVGDYLGKLEEIKKKAKQKTEAANAAQQAVTANTAAIAATQLQAVKASPSIDVAQMVAGASISAKTIETLGTAGNANMMLAAAVEEIGQAVPDESKVQACLLKVAGGGSPGGAAPAN